MTIINRLLLLVLIPAFALAGVVAALAMSVTVACELWLRFWREA